MTDTAAATTTTPAAGQLIAAATQAAVSGAFNKAANDFVHGELRQESLEAVEKLHQRFSQRIQATVDAALKDSTDEDLKKAAVDYCIALSRTRGDCTPKQLAEKAAGGADALRKETKTLLHDLNELEASLKRKVGDRKDDPYAPKSTKPEGEVHPFRKLLSGIAKFFGGAADRSLPPPPPFAAIANDDKPVVLPGEEKPADQTDRTRIYFKLSDYSKSPVQPFVAAFVEKAGYTMTDKDYEEGYAWDKRKNKVKIGKILKDEPGLLEAFREDFFRSSKNLMVVLTRSYEDLARASFGRGWQSCRANASNAVSYAIKEIDIGVMAAYLVSGDDPDIHNPLGRVNLKPYDSVGKTDQWGDEIEAPSKRDTVYLTFNPIGLHHPGFVNAVNRFADEKLNGDKFGKFKLRYGCESYREMEQRTRLPDDAEGALKAIGVTYTKDAQGKITVPGDLSFKGLGLNKLPDLSDVIVEGSLDVSNNKLLTLEGLPTAPVKNLNVSTNLLICFAGCTPEVKGEFNYKDCAYLMTTYGAPKAEKYSYGNGQRDSGRYATSENCVGPIEDPARFPGFKRKD